jgi:hypothetical protein
MEIKDFAGGLYAVGRCDEIGDPGRDIPDAWQKLVRWREASAYRQASHQWLEEHLPMERKSTVEAAGLDWMLDLYLPIV